MFSMGFDWTTGSLISVWLQPGYNWTILLEELAKLEMVALGDVVYGKRRAEPIA